jgi:hypothetical protein
MSCSLPFDPPTLCRFVHSSSSPLYLLCPLPSFPVWPSSAPPPPLPSLPLLFFVVLLPFQCLRSYLSSFSTSCLHWKYPTGNDRHKEVVVKRFIDAESHARTKVGPPCLEGKWGQTRLFCFFSIVTLLS